jgi:DNA-binding NarL/FixJ family response regulator
VTQTAYLLPPTTVPRRPGRPRVTTEELAILQLMANGLTLDSVALRISVSPRTLSRRLRHVCARLGVAHPIQAIVWAAHEGLI